MSDKSEKKVKYTIVAGARGSERMHESAALHRANEGDAGTDLSAAESGVVPARSRAFFRTGVAVAIPRGYTGLVCPRSGNAKNKGLTVLNGPGVVDSGYRGEVGVVLYNSTDEDITISVGDRIAQMVIVPCLLPVWEPSADLGETDRGDKGFGSSGMAGELK